MKREKVAQFRSSRFSRQSAIRLRQGFGEQVGNRQFSPQLQASLSANVKRQTANVK
jgi:hypothetical protein